MPPTAPSPLNPEKVGELAIECPIGPRVQSPDGNPVVVGYPPPAVRGGEAPVAVRCDPASGTRFPVGATQVSCSATDALGQSAACRFVQRVLPPPMLGVTRVLAFGDSLTAGVVAEFGRSVSAQHSYPAQLEQELRNAYRAQSIRVFNEGVPGEEAVEARGRLTSALSLHRPEVVLLMEGTNDLGYSDDRSGPALEAIDRMVRTVQSAGATPVVATIPPIRSSVRPAQAAGVARYNRGLRAIAASRGVALVDIHGVIAGGRCSTGAGRSLPCLGADGLHPTIEGYRLIAGAFFDHLVRQYDRPVNARGDSSAPVTEARGGPTHGS